MRQHPLYFLACIVLAVALQFILSRRLRRSMTVSQVQNNDNTKLSTDDENS